jgi:hypothetical protein
VLVSAPIPVRFSKKEPVMKWLAISLGLLGMLACSGCWRPYYGNRFGQGPFAQPAYGQPAVVQPTYSQPVVEQGAPVTAAPQVMQAAPVQTYQPCVPCQPCCVPCY